MKEGIKIKGKMGFRQSFSLGKQHIFIIESETAMKINSRIIHLHKSSRTNNLAIKLFLEGFKK